MYRPNHPYDDLLNCLAFDRLYIGHIEYAISRADAQTDSFRLPKACFNLTSLRPSFGTFTLPAYNILSGEVVFSSRYAYGNISDATLFFWNRTRTAFSGSV